MYARRIYVFLRWLLRDGVTDYVFIVTTAWNVNKHRERLPFITWKWKLMKAPEQEQSSIVPAVLKRHF